MKTRLKLTGALALTLPLLLSATDAGAAIRPRIRAFAGVASVGALNINCDPGASTGPSTTRFSLKMTRNTSGIDAALLGDSQSLSTSIVARWTGGSMTLGRFERNYSVSSSAKFHCPAPGQTVPTTFTFQPYRGRVKVGQAARAIVNLTQVGGTTVQPFAGLASASEINVNCAVGASTGRSVARLRLKTTHDTTGVPAALLGDDLRRATKVVARWPGGSRTIARFESFVSLSANTRFPCPVHTNPASTSLDITFQPFRGNTQIGVAAHAKLKLNRVGSPS